MRRQYLHLSAYPCEKCKGPVITGSIAVRVTEIEKETEIRPLRAVCLSCGNKQDKVTEPTCHFLPVDWE